MSNTDFQVVEVVHGANKPHSFDLFVAVTGIIALTILSWRLFLNPIGNTAQLCDMFDLGICAVFFVDFLRKLVTSKSKVKYLFTWGLIDLLASVPSIRFTATPIIHTLNFPHLFRIIRGIRAIKSLHAIIYAVRVDFKNAIVAAGLIISEITVVGCSFAVLYFESQDPSANITKANDVLWWSIVTMSTVGYGDFYPVTVGGRLMAVLLMFMGICLFAMLAGVFADTLRSAAVEITTKKKM